MVTCLKRRLLTRRPKEPRKSRRPQTCVWSCLWTGWVAPPPACPCPRPLPKLSLAPLECSLPPAVNTLQILRLTFACPSFPQDSPATRTLWSSSRFVTACSALSFFLVPVFPPLSCKLHTSGMVCVAYWCSPCSQQRPGR